MVRNVTIGVCAYNEARLIPALLDSIQSQELSENVALKEILVVASGCTDGTETIVEERAKLDRRVSLIREVDRRGKASALNLILDRFQGDLLVLLNADARLPPRSLSRLIDPFLRDSAVRIACGAPVPDIPPAGLMHLVQELLWRLHNRTLQALSVRSLPNHCCDEFMVMSRSFAQPVPENLINDGAYFGVLAALRGSSVRFCPEAEVIIEVPRDLAELLRQRRRILRGHQQIRLLLDRSPNTFESLFKDHPDIMLRILLEEMARGLRWIGTLLLVAIPLEVVANLLVAADRVRRRAFPAEWPTVSSYT